MNNSKYVCANALLCIVLTLSAVAHAQDIRIGAALPLSGPIASYTDLFMQGANLAVEHANADHMLSGKLSIVSEDSQASPQRGVIAMTKLVNVEKVPYVLASLSGVSKAIAPIAQRTKTVAVNGGGVSPDLAGLGAFFWNTIPLANFEVRAIIPYLVKERGLKRFVLVYPDDPLGQSILKELESALPGAGGQLVEALSLAGNAQQFSGIAARIREAKPDAIYIATFGAQQISLVKQLRDNGVTQQLVSYSTFSNPEINSLPEARGAIYSMQNIDWASKDPLTKRFADDFKVKFGGVPSVYAANYYGASLNPL